MIYYIENTIDEWHSTIRGYFETLDDAIKAIAECSDWFREKGTGEIYKVGFGLNHKRKLVWKNGEYINF